MVNCPSCHAGIPDGARFCPSCGAEMSLSMIEERRVVTVLFADIVGFTSLSEHRDPEQVKRLIDACFQRLVADVEAFGGRVDKILGDGILALFGAPIAHEDDAERAVRAGLKMQETLIDHNRDVDATLRMRIGINTGEVLVGALRAGGTYTAMGDVVNTASRLQAEAPPGRVLVGPATHALSDGPIRYASFGEITPRGREHSFEAWLAQEVQLRPGEHRRRRDAPLVGRRDEERLLLAGIEFAVARRRALLITIDGEGGVGKSRVADEIVAYAREEHGLRVMEGACVAYGEANVWWPLASALSDHLKFDVTDPNTVRGSGLTKAAALLGRPEDDPEIVRIGEAFLHILGESSTLDRLDPVRVREEVTHAVVSVLQASCKKAALMMVITDVHWSDGVVLQLFEQVLANLAGLPFVLLTTARPDPELAWPPSSSAYASIHLRLEPLDRAATEQMAAAILGEGADPAVVASLYDRSGGNPLFLEELAALVADGGRVGELPNSLRALVSSRLDQLSAEQRAMLDNAAVLGTSGTLVGLLRFAKALNQPADSQTLDSLVEASLLTRDGKRWRFRSQSVRDVAYQTLTKAVRAARHTGTAEIMAQTYRAAETARAANSAADPVAQPVSAGPEGPVSLDEIAHHYATAAELVGELGHVSGVPRDIVGQALTWLIAAGDRASDQHFMRSAIRLSSRGLDLIGDHSSPEHVPARLRLLLIRADANAELRNAAKARVDLEMVLEISAGNETLEAEAEARRILGTVGRLSGNLPAARGELSESVRLWRQGGQPLRLARALRDRAFVELFGGDLVYAEQLLDEAERLTIEHGDARGLAWVEWHRAWLSFVSGNITEAEERLQRAAVTMTSLGDRGGLGWVLGLLAYVRYYQGDTVEAGTLATQVLDEAVERGDDWAAGMMQALQANLRLWEGRTEDALRLAESSRARFKRLSDGFGELQALAPLARANVALGRGPAATRTMEEMEVLAGSHQLGSFLYITEAGTAAHVGEAERAIHNAELALDDAKERGGFLHEAFIAKALGLVQAGEAGDAWIAIDQAASLGFMGPYLTSVKALVEVAVGSFEVALGDAAFTADQPGASYLDLVYAQVAAAFAHARLGSPRAAAASLDAAAVVAGNTGDVVAKALVALARSFIDGEQRGGDGPELDVPLHGWRRLFGDILEQ